MLVLQPFQLGRVLPTQSADGSMVVGPVDSGMIEVQVSTGQVRYSRVWHLGQRRRGTHGKPPQSDHLLPPHLIRPPVLITVYTNSTALDIANRVAILFGMSPKCVDAHYLSFDTRNLNKHTPASALQEIGVLDYGVIRILIRMLGGVVTTRECTDPLSTSPMWLQKLIAASRRKFHSRQGLWAQKWKRWTSFKHVHRQRRNRRSLWRDSNSWQLARGRPWPHANWWMWRKQWASQMWHCYNKQ